MENRITFFLALTVVVATSTVAISSTTAYAQTDTGATTVGLQWFKSRDERASAERGERPAFPVKTFADFDVAGDGQISLDEWMAVVAEAEGPEAFARALFDQADRDGDETITPEEFAGMTNADLAAASAAMDPSQAPADVVVPILVRANN